MLQVKYLLPAAKERLVTIGADALLMDAARLLQGSRINLVVVCREDGKLAGVITKTDIVSRISVCTGHSCRMAAADVMTHDVVSCRENQWLEEVWPTFRNRRLTNIPIVDKNALPLGVLNAGDALQVLLREVHDEEALLRDYVMGVGYR